MEVSNKLIENEEYEFKLRGGGGGGRHASELPSPQGGGDNGNLNNNNNNPAKQEKPIRNQEPKSRVDFWSVWKHTERSKGEFGLTKRDGLFKPFHKTDPDKCVNVYFLPCRVLTTPTEGAKPLEAEPLYEAPQREEKKLCETTTVPQELSFSRDGDELCNDNKQPNDDHVVVENSDESKVEGAVVSTDTEEVSALSSLSTGGVAEKSGEFDYVPYVLVSPVTPRSRAHSWQGGGGAATVRGPSPSSDASEQTSSRALPENQLRPRFARSPYLLVSAGDAEKGDKETETGDTGDKETAETRLRSKSCFPDLTASRLTSTDVEKVIFDLFGCPPASAEQKVETPAKPGDENGDGGRDGDGDRDDDDRDGEDGMNDVRTDTVVGRGSKFGTRNDGVSLNINERFQEAVNTVIIDDERRQAFEVVVEPERGGARKRRNSQEAGDDAKRPRCEGTTTAGPEPSRQGEVGLTEKEKEKTLSSSETMMRKLKELQELLNWWRATTSELQLYLMSGGTVGDQEEDSAETPRDNNEPALETRTTTETPMGNEGVMPAAKLSLRQARSMVTRYYDLLWRHLRPAEVPSGALASRMAKATRQSKRRKTGSLPGDAPASGASQCESRPKKRSRPEQNVNPPMRVGCDQGDIMETEPKIVNSPVVSSPGRRKTRDNEETSSTTTAKVVPPVVPTVEPVVRKSPPQIPHPTSRTESPKAAETVDNSAGTQGSPVIVIDDTDGGPTTTANGDSRRSSFAQCVTHGRVPRNRQMPTGGIDAGGVAATAPPVVAGMATLRTRFRFECSLCDRETEVFRATANNQSWRLGAILRDFKSGVWSASYMCHNQHRFSVSPSELARAPWCPHCFSSGISSGTPAQPGAHNNTSNKGAGQGAIFRAAKAQMRLQATLRPPPTAHPGFGDRSELETFSAEQLVAYLVKNSEISKRAPWVVFGFSLSPFGNRPILTTHPAFGLMKHVKKVVSLKIHPDKCQHLAQAQVAFQVMNSAWKTINSQVSAP